MMPVVSVVIPTAPPPDVLNVVVDYVTIGGVVVALAVGGIAIWQAVSAKRQANSAEIQAAEAKRQADSAETSAAAAVDAARAAEAQVVVAREALVQARLGEVRAVVKALRQATFGVVTSANGVINFLSRTDLPDDVGDQRWSAHSHATATFSDATSDTIGVITEVPFQPAISNVLNAGHNLMTALQPLWLRRINGVIPASDPAVVEANRLVAVFDNARATLHLGESAWLADPTGDRGVARAIVDRLNGPTP